MDTFTSCPLFSHQRRAHWCNRNSKSGVSGDPTFVCTKLGMWFLWAPATSLTYNWNLKGMGLPRKFLMHGKPHKKTPLMTAQLN